MSGQESSSISFWDVRNAAEEVGKEHYGRITFELTLPIRRDLRHALDVRCVFKGGIGSLGGSVYERGASGTFPCQGSKTFSGLLLNLVYQLDAKLSEERRQASEARSGRLPGF